MDWRDFRVEICMLCKVTSRWFTKLHPLTLQYEKSEEIYVGEIKFLLELPSLHSPFQRVLSTTLEKLLGRADRQTLLSEHLRPGRVCTVRQFVQANTRLLVKGQVFPWNEGSLQTGMVQKKTKTSGLLDTWLVCLLVCVCVGGYRVCLGVFLPKWWLCKRWTLVCVRARAPYEAHEHGAMGIKWRCVSATAFRRTAGLVSSGDRPCVLQLDDIIAALCKRLV